MKGLVIKDFLTIRAIASSYLIVLGFFAIISIFTSNMSFSIVITLMLAMLPITAMAYDERSNFNRYALTMPISSTTLVLSKYIFGFILSSIGGILGFASLFFMSNDFTSWEKLLFAVSSFSVGLLSQAILLPIMFKVGTEKGRLYMMAVFLLPTVLILLVANSPIAPMINNFAENLSLQSLTMALPIIAIVIYILTVILSIKIAKKRIW